MKVKEESEIAGLRLNIRKMKIMASSPITSWQIDEWGNSGHSGWLYFFLGGCPPKSLQMVICSHEIKTLTPWKKRYDQPRQHIKKQRCYFVNKGLSSQGCSFSSSHVWMWESDCEEGWVPKNLWTVVLEKTLESPLDCKEIQPAHPKGNQSCIFIGRTDDEAETPILWPPDARRWLI